MKSVKLVPENIDNLPKWRYREEDPAVVLRRVWPNFAVLAVLALVANLIGARSLRRYPIAG
jgi:hypothetical protein